MIHSILFLLLFLAEVESNCNDNAVGKHGEVGRYQIRQCYLDDVNRIKKWNYTLDEMHNAENARNVVIAYLEYYGENYRKENGKNQTIEVLARIHNGGPYGYRKNCTIVYWNKIKKAMEKK
jgi:hypothetical protein